MATLGDSHIQQQPPPHTQLTSGLCHNHSSRVRVPHIPLTMALQGLWANGILFSGILISAVPLVNALAQAFWLQGLFWPCSSHGLVRYLCQLQNTSLNILSLNCDSLSKEKWGPEPLKRFLLKCTFIPPAASYLVKEAIHNIQMLRWVGSKNTSSGIVSNNNELVIAKSPDSI